MDLIALVMVAAFIIHAFKVARDEHGHVRDSAARQLRQDHPDRSDAWIKRHAHYRAVAHWPHLIPEIGRAIKEDRQHVRLRREQNKTDHLRRFGDILEELKRGRVERDEDEAYRENARRGQTAPLAAGDDASRPRSQDHTPAGSARTMIHCDPADGASGAGDVPDGPESSVVHHDHTYTLPGECGECGGPGPGIPLVPGDHICYEGTADDGTPVSGDATVLSNDGKRVLLQTPDGRQIDAAATLPKALPPAADKGPAPSAPASDGPQSDPGYKEAGSGEPVVLDGQNPSAAPGSWLDQCDEDEADWKRRQESLRGWDEADALAKADAKWGFERTPEERRLLGQADPFPEPEPDDWPAGIPHRRSGDAPSPAANGGMSMTTDTTQNGSAAADGTGEAPDFAAGETIASGHVKKATGLLANMEQYQSDLVTAADLGGDAAITGSLDAAMEHLRGYGEAMQNHQRALAAHKSGQEYADSVQSPANSKWLQSQ